MFSIASSSHREVCRRSLRSVRRLSNSPRSHRRIRIPHARRSHCQKQGHVPEMYIRKLYIGTSRPSRSSTLSYKKLRDGMPGLRLFIENPFWNFSALLGTRADLKSFSRRLDDYHFVVFVGRFVQIYGHSSMNTYFNLTQRGQNPELQIDIINQIAVCT